MDVQPLTYSAAGLPTAGRPQREHRAGRTAARRVAPHRLLPDSRRPAAHHPDARRIAAGADGFGRRNARVALVRESVTNTVNSTFLNPGVPEWSISSRSPGRARPLRVDLAHLGRPRRRAWCFRATSAEAGHAPRAVVVGSVGAPQFRFTAPTST